MEYGLGGSSRDINLLALVKDGESYIFLFDDYNSDEALRTLARYASDRDLSFTWQDATLLSRRIRQCIQGALKSKHSGKQTGAVVQSKAQNLMDAYSAIYTTAEENFFAKSA